MLKKQDFSYSFDGSKCDECGGKCCVGESGYIWISASEIKKLSEFLGLKTDEFIKKYLFKTQNKYSIKEKEYNGGYACIFFDEQNKNCGVYEYRPSQCRTFPFWDYFKQNLEELQAECIGVKF
ncbi:hypothetical protein LMG7974_00073 [Campylobacter majalis]|uniref:YkgJ family cysteine cluster protein n=1 Tax=Campylobacter majalis TaxID=2790656 RepID=A0ABM8Q1W5_9BACT|nr:YkgJ family cysteine cluster protein [Campylobacter majalis]CAD7286766.1 hypothetical protein LMG7974_00073 [Campylobacter majalis]